MRWAIIAKTERHQCAAVEECLAGSSGLFLPNPPQRDTVALAGLDVERRGSRRALGSGPSRAEVPWGPRLGSRAAHQGQDTLSLTGLPLRQPPAAVANATLYLVSTSADVTRTGISPHDRMTHVGVTVLSTVTPVRPPVEGGRS